MNKTLMVNRLKKLAFDIDMYANSPTISVKVAEDFSDRSWVIIKELTPYISDPHLAYIAGAAAEICCRYSSVLEQWQRLMHAGLILVSVGQLYQMDHARDEDRYPVNHTKSLRYYIDDICYSFHKNRTPLAISQTVETSFGSNFRTAQVMGLLNSLDGDLGKNFTDQVNRYFLEGFENAVPTTASLAPTEARWQSICIGVEAALNTNDILRQWALSQGYLAETPLLAASTGSPVIFLAASNPGGAAIYFHGGQDWSQEPFSIDLSKLTKEYVTRVCQAMEASPSRMEINAILEDVAKVVFEPMRDVLAKNDNVIFVPVGECLRLPLTAALAAGDIDSLTVTVVPSPGLCIIPALSSAIPYSPVVVIADPSKGKNYIPLVEKEARRVSSVWLKDPDFLVRGPWIPSTQKSDRMRVIKHLPNHFTSPSKVISRISNAGLVHLACHGWIDHEGDLDPYLLVKGVIPLSSFDSRHVRMGSTYVLSACFAGGSAQSNPIEHVGFPAMLLSAGAGKVIASIYPVPDTFETVAFMEKIHYYLNVGSSPASALRNSMTWAKKVSLSFSVWAGFQCYGTP